MQVMLYTLLEQHGLTGYIQHRYQNGTDSQTTVVSPRSVNTNNLGVNMAEFVLDSSPMGQEVVPTRRRFVSNSFAAPLCTHFLLYAVNFLIESLG